MFLPCAWTVFLRVAGGVCVQTVVLTSGTLSPIELYPKLLDFMPVACRSLQMTLTRECLCPVVLTRGADQMPVSSKYESRKDPNVLRCAPLPLSHRPSTLSTPPHFWIPVLVSFLVAFIPPLLTSARRCMVDSFPYI